MRRNLRFVVTAAVAAAAATAASPTSALGLGAGSVSVPAAPPAAPSLSGHVPRLPTAPSLSVPAVRPGAPRAPSAPPLPGVATVVAASGIAAQGPVPGTTPPPGYDPANQGTPPPGAPPGSNPEELQRQRAKEIAETKRLGKEVKRLQTCLPLLPEFNRNLLGMRVGLKGKPMPREAVAQKLKMSVGREQAVERSSLKKMRSAKRQGRCGSALGFPGAFGAFPPGGFGAFKFPGLPSRAALLAAAGFGPAAGSAALSALLRSQAPAKQEPRYQVLGDTASSSDDNGKHAARAVGSRVAAVAPDHGRGIVIALVLLLLAANLLAAGVWLARRRAERNRFTPEMPTPRTYDGPGGELDFGPGGREAPERPEGAGEPASRDRRRGDY